MDQNVFPQNNLILKLQLQKTNKPTKNNQPTKKPLMRLFQVKLVHYLLEFLVNLGNWFYTLRRSSTSQVM